LNELVNTSGRGPVGTRSNSPICDDATMACNQNRPAVPHGTGANAGIPGWKPGLTDADREFISTVSNLKNLKLRQLIRLRDETVQLQEKAINDFGPASTTAIWFQKLIAAYDEAIAEAKWHLSSAIEAAQRVLDNPSAREKDRRKVASNLIDALRKYESPQGSNEKDSEVAGAWNLVVELVKRDAEEKEADVERLVNREKRTPGSVSDDEFRKELLVGMGVEHQKQLLGIGEGEGPSKMMQLAVDSLVLVSDRHIARLDKLIEKEERSPGSVSKQRFVRMLQTVMGDGRQKELLGIARRDSMAPAIKVMKVFIKTKDASVRRLMRKQEIPGSGITQAQIDQAIEDLDAAKEVARQWGVSIPHGDFSEGEGFKTSRR